MLIDLDLFDDRSFNSAVHLSLNEVFELLEALLCLIYKLQVIEDSLIMMFDHWLKVFVYALFNLRN